MLDELVEVYAEQFENQAQVLPMDKCVLEPQEMMVVVFVELTVKLNGISVIVVCGLKGQDRTKSRTDTSIIL